MANKGAQTPRGLSIHYTKDVVGWLPGFVEKVAELTGKCPAELFRDAFCEVWGKKFPELADKYKRLKRLAGE